MLTHWLTGPHASGHTGAGGWQQNKYAIHVQFSWVLPLIMALLLLRDCCMICYNTRLSQVGQQQLRSKLSQVAQHQSFTRWAVGPKHITHISPASC